MREKMLKIESTEMSTNTDPASDAATPTLERLASCLHASTHPLFLTGAGMSIASGIPAYRYGTDATWARHAEEWATRRRFLDDPAAWWTSFWRAQRDAVTSKQPNAGHAALVRLSTLHEGVRVVTQNIDGLDRAAGFPAARLIEVHGRADRLRCLDDSCRGWAGFAEDAAYPGPTGAPSCPVCGHPARPLVLFFDETYDSHPTLDGARATAWLQAADVMVLVGTSNSVGITDFAVSSGRARGVPIWSINPTPLGDAETIAGKAEELLPRLADALAHASR